MQASLQAGVSQPGPTATGHPFSGGVWSSNPWFLAAASIGTVALIAVGVWQRGEINHLRQTVSQLQQKAVSAQVATSSPTLERPSLTKANGSLSATQNKPGIPAHRPDTVYIDRYVNTPAPSRSERVLEEAAPPLTKAVDKGYVTTRRMPVPTVDLTHQQTNSTPKLQNDIYDASSTPIVTNKNSSRKSTQSIVANQPVNQSIESTRSGEKVRNKPGRNDLYTDTYSPTKSEKAVTNQTVQTTPQREAVVETTGGASASYELIASRPLSTKSINWNALLARQARRMRPNQSATPTPVAEKAPTVEPESRTEHVAIRVRVGIGTEIASQLWGKGIFTEVLLGRNWLLGVGLNQTTYKTKTTFVDDVDFNDHTRRDFRNEFVPPNIDPSRAIKSINTQTSRLQIPVYLGYRVPITQSIAFLPTAGTYLNLNSIEKATFYLPYYFPKRGYEELTGSSSCPVELINSLSLSTGIEWQNKHWVAQVSPVLTIPFQSNAKPPLSQTDWQQNATLGLRARVLYQF